MTVDELRSILAGLPDETPILVSGYESGFAVVAHAGVLEVQELDRDDDADYLGRFVVPAEAAEELDGRGAAWLYVAGGEPPKLIGNPITALVLSREGR